MTRRRNFPLLLLPLLFLIALPVYYWTVSAKKSAPSASPERKELIKSSQDQKLQKFSLTGFDETGKSNWKLEGENAKIDPGQKVILDQNVTLRLRDNTVIRTEHVQWSQDGGTLRTNEIVTVDHENTKVRGRGAYGRPNEGFIQLNHDIEMTINFTTTLVCQGPMKIFYNSNTMQFYRKVRVTDERGVLTANRMDVHFDPDKKQVKEIVAIGNVIIERGPDTTRSRRAIYSVETGSIRLEGNPEVTLNKGSGGILSGALRNQGSEKIL